MARFYDRYVVRNEQPLEAVISGVEELQTKVAQMIKLRSTEALNKAHVTLSFCSQKLSDVEHSLEQENTISSSSFRP